MAWAAPAEAKARTDEEIRLSDVEVEGVYELLL